MTYQLAESQSVAPQNERAAVDVQRWWSARHLSTNTWRHTDMPITQPSHGLY